MDRGEVPRRERSGSCRRPLRGALLFLAHGGRASGQATPGSGSRSLRSPVFLGSVDRRVEDRCFQAQFLGAHRLEKRPRPHRPRVRLERAARPATQRKALMLLQGILRRAVLRGLLPANPVPDLDSSWTHEARFLA
jgi:hypothetical protein